MFVNIEQASHWDTIMKQLCFSLLSIYIYSLSLVLLLSLGENSDRGSSHDFSGYPKIIISCTVQTLKVIKQCHIRN